MSSWSKWLRTDTDQVASAAMVEYYCQLRALGLCSKVAPGFYQKVKQKSYNSLNEINDITDLI